MHTRRLSSAVIAGLLAATGCLDDGGDIDAVVPDEIAPDDRDTDGDGLPDLDGLPEDPNMVCGDDTAGSARTPNGTRVMFCVLDTGEEVVAETGAMGQSSYLKEIDEVDRQSQPCALDLFLRLTDDSTPVPAALVDSCASDRVAPLVHREVVKRPVFATAAAEDAPVDVVSYSHYCGSATAFRDERCYSCYGTPSSGCVASCETWWHTNSDDTCSRFLGHWGNDAVETVASCDGQTLFTGLRGDWFGWHANFSMVVNDGYWAWGWMKSDVFKSDFRFISTSLWPARHRLSKRFIGFGL